MRAKMTVHFDDSHQINGDVLEHFKCVKTGDYLADNYDLMDDKWGYVPTIVQIGAELTLISIDDVSPNNIRSGFVATRYDLQEGGVGGNSNPDIERYHGWRGTTDDRAVHAHGVRRVLKMKTLKNGNISVTVGPDIHPEWP